MISRISSLVCLALLATQPSAGDKKALAELEGTWRLEELESDADTVGIPGLRPTLVIRGDRLLYGGEEIARLLIDTAADPRVIDLRFAKPERTFEGVYALDKETLKICLNARSEGAKERPSGFSTKDQPSWRLLTLRRSEKGKEDLGPGFVGVALRYDNARNEVIVADTFEDAPARKAGLRKDDVLLEIAGAAPANLRSAVEAVRQSKPGAELAVRLRRGDKESELKIKVGVLPFKFVVGLD